MGGLQICVRIRRMRAALMIFVSDFSWLVNSCGLSIVNLGLSRLQ